MNLRLETEAGRPISHAELRFHNREHEYSARFDSLGVARLTKVPLGAWRAVVRRLGIQQVDVELHVDSGTNSYTIIATEVGHDLAPVRIETGRIVSSRHMEFEARRARGTANAMITRDEIARRNPIQLSQLLRGRSGLRIGDSLGITVAISTRGSKPARTPNGAGFFLAQCVLRVSVDGVLLPPLSDLNTIVPGDVYGMELYYGASRLPPELAGLSTDSWCGLIAVWTK
ncbi:MAG: hypothetical protein H7Z40_19190 [Phycisphaerae bacterium]|nr:hypothetical protein [Gemmatimonadaceae bacterium]